MKRQAKYKNKSSGTGNYPQRRQGAKARQSVRKRNARLRRFPELLAEFEARKKEYLKCTA